MGRLEVIHIGVSLLAFFCIWKCSVSADQMTEKCTEASLLINNITATTPMDNDGCVMQFHTNRGTCCLIGVKLNQREHFKGRFFIEKKCYKLKCLYNKKKKWEKCKCQVNKVKLPKKNKTKKSKKPKVNKTTTTTTTTTTPKPISSTPSSTPRPSTSSKPASMPPSQPMKNSLPPLLPEQALRQPMRIVGPPLKPLPQAPIRKTTPSPPLPTTSPKGKPCVFPGTGIQIPSGREIPALNKKIGRKCWSAYCSNDGEIVFDEYECPEDLDLTTSIGLGSTRPFRFMTIVPGDEE